MPPKQDPAGSTPAELVSDLLLRVTLAILIGTCAAAVLSVQAPAVTQAVVAGPLHALAPVWPAICTSLAFLFVVTAIGRAHGPSGHQ